MVNYLQDFIPVTDYSILFHHQFVYFPLKMDLKKNNLTCRFHFELRQCVQSLLAALSLRGKNKQTQSGVREYADLIKKISLYIKSGQRPRKTQRYQCSE